MIRRSVNGARYQRIATVFRDLIQSGELSPGTRLPSETEVAQQYGVSRKTAHDSFDSLHDDWLVEVRQGEGTFVRVWGAKQVVELTPGQEAHVRPPTPAEREEGDLHPKIPLVIVVDPDGGETHYSADVVRIRPWEAPS